MAKSWADYKREAKERAKAAAKGMPDLADPYLKRTFAAFFEADTANDADGGDWSEITEMLGYGGVHLPSFAENTWPEFEGSNLQASGVINRGALGRAEALADAMQDGLRILAEKINRFKREEIEARITELEKSDLSDPAAKKRALEEIVELNRIEARLAKSVRLTIPVYEIKG
ncbi:hypothetical protein [Jiella marina]|uniref:hypothetical protein n=1 Tax=Jiella sp. LLJ827 TaxID=2917712 RepID=UPI002100D119|nr:hypothetical protein [Jiella sp. LLJ827]MCQ0989940.1 hypothetical protein [Jiella sp. LLJ827]